MVSSFLERSRSRGEWNEEEEGWWIFSESSFQQGRKVCKCNSWGAESVVTSHRQEMMFLQSQRDNRQGGAESGR